MKVFNFLFNFIEKWGQANIYILYIKYCQKGRCPHIAMVIVVQYE